MNYSRMNWSTEDNFNMLQEGETARRNYLCVLTERQNKMDRLEISMLQKFDRMENSLNKLSSFVDEFEFLARELNMFEQTNSNLQPERDMERSQLSANAYSPSSIPELSRINNRTVESHLDDYIFGLNHKMQLNQSAINRPTVSQFPMTIYDDIITSISHNPQYNNSCVTSSHSKVLQSQVLPTYDNLNTIPKLSQHEIQSNQISDQHNDKLLKNTSFCISNTFPVKDNVNPLSRAVNLACSHSLAGNVAANMNSVLTQGSPYVNFASTASSIQQQLATDTIHHKLPEKLILTNSAALQSMRQTDLAISSAESFVTNENITDTLGMDIEKRTVPSEKNSELFENEVVTKLDNLALSDESKSLENRNLINGDHVVSTPEFLLENVSPLEGISEFSDKDSVELLSKSDEAEHNESNGKGNEEYDQQEASANKILESENSENDQFINKDIVSDSEVHSALNESQHEETISTKVENKANYNPEILNTSVPKGGNNESDGESNSSLLSNSSKIKMTKDQGEQIGIKNIKNVDNEKEIENCTKLNPTIDNRKKMKTKKKTKIRKDSILARKSSLILSEESSESGISQNLPLTSSAAYKSLIGGTVALEIPKRIDLESESEDDVENALRIVIQKREPLSNVEDSPKKSLSPESEKEEPISETKLVDNQPKTAENHKQPSKSGHLPQTSAKMKLTKASRIALGLDSDSDSVPVQTTMKKENDEQSDEFDFFN